MGTEKKNDVEVAVDLCSQITRLKAAVAAREAFMRSYAELGIGEEALPGGGLQEALARAQVRLRLLVENSDSAKVAP